MEYLFGSGYKSCNQSVEVRELLAAEQEYELRKAALNVCINMIANAIGRCELRTFEDGREVVNDEYFMWNFEPNTNQNSTAFWHKAIYQVCKQNEALIVVQSRRNKSDCLYVADSFASDHEVIRAKTYSSVTVDGFTFNRSFRENEVLHLRLNHLDISSVTNELFNSYCRMLSAAMNAYKWENGHHLKVHVEQLASGEDGWEAKFQEMLNKQIEPFIRSGSSILPEFDGYKYEIFSNGGSGKGMGDVQALTADIFDFTARSFLIPAVLVNGKVEATNDAYKRFLTDCIDPICDQITEEIMRKRYGFDRLQRGDYCRLDSSAIIHFDIFAEAPNVEKLVGSAAFSPNDVLRAAGQPEIPETWADEHYITKNIATMKEALASVSGKGETQ